MYVYDHAIVNDRTHVVVLLGNLCKGKKTVELCHEVGIGLYLVDIVLYVSDKFGKQLLLKTCYLLVGTKNFLFVFFQFLSDISLGICQCLLTNPFLRNLILECVSHLEIISEHIIETDFQ